MNNPAPPVPNPAPPVPNPALSVPKGFDLFKVWKEYEAMAMHFNDLLMRLRSQSLAAVATFSTAAGVLLKSDSIGKDFRWGTLAAVFFSLAWFWTAIWLLDFLYYDRLLLGAVEALEYIEGESEKGETRVGKINLSTEIEKTVKGEGLKGNLARGKGIVFFYSLVLLLLIFGTVLSLLKSPETIEDVRRVMRGSPFEQRSNNP